MNAASSLELVAELDRIVAALHAVERGLRAAAAESPDPVAIYLYGVAADRLPGPTAEVVKAQATAARAAHNDRAHEAGPA